MILIVLRFMVESDFIAIRLYTKGVFADEQKAL